jgi:hypothetical protein
VDKCPGCNRLDLRMWNNKESAAIMFAMSTGELEVNLG